MAWANTFDGDHFLTVTVANSGDHGDALASTSGCVYSTEWAVAGSASLEILIDGDFALPAATSDRIGIRAYMLIAEESSLTFDEAVFDAAAGTWTLGPTDISQHAASLTGVPFRYECERARFGIVTVTHRLFIGDNVGGLEPDVEVQGSTSVSSTVSATGTESPRIDELVVTDGGWPGPIMILGQATATGTAIGQAVELPPLPPATGAPVRDMWIGPLGAMQRVQQKAATSRPRDLGVAEFTSLEGRVTTSRSRAPAARSEWAWEDITADMRDVLVELAMLSRTIDTTVEVADPAVRNLMTPEQSRGYPVAGTTDVDRLYQYDGAGSLTVGAASDRIMAVIDGGEDGGTLVWLHSYHGVRGWPVMPGWPVHLAVEDWGTNSLAQTATLVLEYFARDGLLVGRAEGTGAVSADAPADAVTVSPRAVFTGTPPSATIIGGASLTYAPPPDTIPLGDGCPTVAITGYTDTPNLPWYTVGLSVVEVTSSATR